MTFMYSNYEVWTTNEKYKNPLLFGAANINFRSSDVLHQTTYVVAAESPIDLIFAFLDGKIGNINRFKYFGKDKLMILSWRRNL